MHDQANQLRQLIQQGSCHLPRGHHSAPRLVTVTSGKGGVGTTTVAVNLAAMLARQGHRVALIDADPRGGNAAVLCRLEPRCSLVDVLQGRCTLHEALQAGPGGIQVLPGDWASGGLLEASNQTLTRLLDALSSLARHFDYMLVDAGSGLNRVARHFWPASKAVLLVTSPEVTSIMDAYASIKVFDGGAGTVPVLVAVNQVSDPETAREAHERLGQACWRFLGLRPVQGGLLSNDTAISEACRTGRPFVLDAPACEPAREIRRLAQAVEVVMDQTVTPADTTRPKNQAMRA